MIEFILFPSLTLLVIELYNIDMEKMNLNKKNTQKDWNAFFEKTKDAEPRKYLVDAIQYVQNNGTALDIGAGALRDTRYLLDQGFEQVTAMDGEDSIQVIEKEINDSRLETVISNFEDFDYKENTYDIINAQYSLPFMNKEYFSEIIGKIKNSLKVNGIFTGTFFGNNDEWNNGTSTAQNFQTKEEVENMFEDFEILDLLEKEENRQGGTKDIKHWHTLHLIAKKIL